MEKTNLIYVKLSDEQIQEVQKLNKFKKKMIPSYAIIWQGKGQIFGDENLMSRFWSNWTQELSQKEKEKSIDLRAIFNECIKDDEYVFDSYVQEDYRAKITDITKELAKELNDRRIGMVSDEYEEALARVRAGTDYESQNGGNSYMKNILPIIIVIIVLASLSTLFNF